MDYCVVKQSNFKWKYNEASLFQFDNDKKYIYYSSTVCVLHVRPVLLPDYEMSKKNMSNEIWLLKSVDGVLF